MAKTKKTAKSKIINLDLWITNKANKNDWERYDALLVVFGNFLFQKKIGTHGGRETAMGPNVKLVRTNFWYVLDSGKTKAVNELKRMVNNFRLTTVTEIKVGKTIESNTDYKKKFEKEKEFSWVYFR